MAQASEIKKQYKKRTLFQETWRRLTKNRGAMLGLAFLSTAGTGSGTQPGHLRL